MPVSAMPADALRREAMDAEAHPRTGPPGRTLLVAPVPAETISRGPYALWLKPTADRLGAAVLLVLLAPLLAVVALAVRVVLGPGVIYRQTRVGLNGMPFTIYKFRTMRPGEAGAKEADDPRHTPLGRVLRRYSLDELPQLWNVWRGDMSLVGPRPEQVHIVAALDLWSHPRHRVRPGLTGRWQVSPHRAEPLQNHLEEDIPYVERITLLGDLRIVAQTVAAVSNRSGW
jgi:lipopolysaccharide/colanic/teichoic acid biosynthesis glycosyltransferase